MTDKPTIHILGSGALGSLWAAKLSAKNNVVLLIKSSKINPNNKTHHFQFIDQDKTTRFALPCETSNASSASHAPIDILLVFTKSYDTVTAVQQIKNRITPASSIVLFQNGMGSQQAITELLPSNTVIAASTTEGANRSNDQTIIYAGKGETWLGAISNNPRNNTQQEDTENVLNLLLGTGLSVFHSPNIWEKLWLKLAINCAINPFTAILNCSNGELPNHEFFNRKIKPLCQELSQAMGANHIEKSPQALEAIVTDVITKTASNISSMLQDVRAGKQTEIEYINGYIEMIAETTGRHFPVNLSLLEKVRRIKTKP